MDWKKETQTWLFFKNGSNMIKFNTLARTIIIIKIATECWLTMEINCAVYPKNHTDWYKTSFWIQQNLSTMNTDNENDFYNTIYIETVLNKIYQRNIMQAIWLHVKVPVTHLTYNVFGWKSGWKCDSKSWCFAINPLPLLENWKISLK